MILDWLLWFSGISGALAVLLNVLGVSIYNLNGLKRQRAQRLRPHAKQFKQRPWVTVVIPARNCAATIEACLASLATANYRKLRIILADNGSQDGTKTIARRYMATRPNKQFKLYGARRRLDRNELIKRAYKAYGDGQLVMLLDADAVVDKTTISRAVGYFNFEPDLDLLNFNYKVRRSWQASAIFQNFSLILRNRARQANSAFNSDYFADFQGAAMYSEIAFRQLAGSGSLCVSPLLRLGDKKLHQAYAHDAAVLGNPLRLRDFLSRLYGLELERLSTLIGSLRLLFVKPSPDYTIFLVWIRLPLSLIFSLAAAVVPVVLAYFLYLTIALHQPGFLLATWAALIIYLFFAIAEDVQLRFREKMKLFGLVPMSFGWFCLLTFLQYFVLAINVLRRSFLSAQERDRCLTA